MNSTLWTKISTKKFISSTNSPEEMTQEECTAKSMEQSSLLNDRPQLERWHDWHRVLWPEQWRYSLSQCLELLLRKFGWGHTLHEIWILHWQLERLNWPTQKDSKHFCKSLRNILHHMYYSVSYASKHTFRNLHIHEIFKCNDRMTDNWNSKKLIQI